MTSAKNATASQETPSTGSEAGFGGLQSLAGPLWCCPHSISAPTCLHQPVSATQPGKLEMIHQIQILEKHTVTYLGNIPKEQETTGRKTSAGH